MKEQKEYGNRWLAEIVFSALKRVLGDSVSSRGFIAQKAEDEEVLQQHQCQEQDYMPLYIPQPLLTLE